MKVHTIVGSRSRVFAATSLTLAIVLAGCSSTKLDEPAAVETRTPTEVNPNASAGANQPAAESAVKNVDLSANTNAALPAGVGRVVYFDFDSFVVKDEFRPVVEGHGKFLSANKAKRILIEGHTDERGSREYNLALGQKRAEAVQRSLLLVGASEGQVEAVSFGEERPAAQGADESAWAKNRRAELKDR